MKQTSQRSSVPSERPVIVVHALTAGGVQRVAAELANRWANEGRPVCVVTLSGDEDDHFVLAESIDRIALDVMADSANSVVALLNTVRRVRALRRAIQSCDPTTVVSLMDRTNVLVLLATRGLSLPVIVAERSNPRRHAIGRIWSGLRRWLYPSASAVVVQTRLAGSFFQRFVPAARLRVIPNAVDARPETSEEKRLPVVVGLGRMSHEKGFDLLIEAWGRVADSLPEWNLVLHGDGPQRPALEELAGKAAAGRVCFAGWTRDPAAALTSASIFVLPSRYEGFPNALLEAMASGLAVISFDCECGPSEIIRHEVDGLLIPEGDVAALKEALEDLCNDAELRARLGREARAVSRRFGVDRYADAWDDLLARAGSELQTNDSGELG